MTNKNILLCSLTIILFTFAQISMQQTVPLPQSVIRAMATRAERYHHYLWHSIRDNWNQFSSSTRSQLTRLGWAPPRPSRAFDSQGNAIAITDNNSGEDFLYMHRQMIAKTNKILARNKERYGRVVGWKNIPAPGDSDWPTPRAYTIPGDPVGTSDFAFIKSDNFYYDNIQPWEDVFKDPDVLRSITLGELGSQIEITVHNWLHVRFSSKSRVGYRLDTGEAIPYFDQDWDNSRYNWLADTYASHVNPVFWKLHGWIDDRIEDWRKANGLSSIRWGGTWEGGPMSSLSSVLRKSGTSLRVPTDTSSNDDSEMIMDSTMEEVLKIVLESGKASRFTDKVEMSPQLKAKLKLKLPVKSAPKLKV